MAASTYYNDNLCNKIKQRRIELGLTTEEAAHLAGIETKIWERYEAGRPIRIEKRESICKVLGLESDTRKSNDNVADATVKEQKKFVCEDTRATALVCIND